jgi:N-acetylglucosamine-6-phosphate deacetylase
MTTVLASDAVCPPGRPAPGWVAVEDAVIVDVGTGRPPGGARGAHDLGDALLVPGFVDLQCNGVGADDLAAADPDGWRRVAATLARHGTTAFCGTLISAPLDRYAAPLATAAAMVRGGPGDAATMLGVHLEGPFLGGAPGAHHDSVLRPADVAWLESVLRTHPGLLRIVTLAPEADPGLRATELLTEAGVTVALGHSRASFAEARAATDAGARLVTHLFNGMGPLHHRDPGLAGAALDDDRLTPTLIADGVHVHPAVLRLALARKPNVAIVSDAVAVTGGVLARDGAAYLGDGTLTGATTLLDHSIATLVGAGIAVERAIEIVASVPARVLGLVDRGGLESGRRADVVALDPTTFAPRAVWIGGRPVPFS